MLRRRLGLAVAAATALFLSGFVLASCGGGEEETTTTTTQTTQTTAEETTTAAEEQGPVAVRVDVVGGVPKGGIVRETVSEGDEVVLVVASDVEDEVHIHGYDVSRDVGPGRVARIAFVAKLPGRFEVELEERGVQIAELTVTP